MGRVWGILKVSYCIMQQEMSARRKMARVALCVVVSLLVHGVMGWGLLALMSGEGKGRGSRWRDAGKAAQRVLQVVREAVEEQQKPFAKTDPDAEEAVPVEADFVGKRNAVASGAADAPERRSEDPVPTQDGEEDTGDMVTFDQERQDGDREHDGKVAAQQESPAVGAPPPVLPPLPPQPEVADAEAAPEDVEAPEEGALSVLPQPLVADGDMRLKPTENEPKEAVLPPLPQPPVAGVAPVLHALPPGMAGAVYDPSLAEHMQPQTAGFRTRERRTRSTGRFVIGSKPSLNVASTPMGRYEEEIYRRIAYYWYIACDDHRGDIIPGSVVISLRINARGQLANMDLVRRRGASMSQQSFTFAAIRRAALPPMPPAVRQEMVGDLLEMIFQFNFD